MHVCPHPLDFDWRFETETVDKICALLPRKGRVLALGAPTVAEQLERDGREMMLIDRQPERSIASHHRADIDFLAAPMSGFEAAVVDPPWYPEQLIRWTTYAASCVGPGGVILASAWPASTRPDAQEQLEGAFDAISDWGVVTRLPFYLKYHVPLFERRAVEVSQRGPLSSSPGKGLLISISVVHQPRRLAPPPGHELWQRFNIDDYQLALRLNGADHLTPKILRHPAAVGWQWPFVSARAPGRSEIDLWSSEGEIARVQCPAGVAALLRTAFSSSDTQTFLGALEPLPELKSWKMPRPPYRSLIEWQHRQ